MFQTPKFIKKVPDKGLVFCKNTKISMPECTYKRYICDTLSALSDGDSDGAAIKSISFSLGIPDDVRDEINREIVGNDEEYALSLGEESFVYAKTPDGFLRALSTLMQLRDAGELSELLIYDYPASPERGYRVYMPGRMTMGYFLEMVDFLVYYKFNALIIEVGGAMEYERRPKINEKWVEFCREVGEYSGKADEIQTSFAWSKNSIHYETEIPPSLRKLSAASLRGIAESGELRSSPSARLSLTPTISATHTRKSRSFRSTHTPIRTVRRIPNPMRFFSTFSTRS